ncbi:MAG: 2-oxoacid:acceptor oxidoreductase family protein [Acutalibacteraceae bacterium]
MKKSLIFSGAGGQGIVSAGIMTAKAAVDAGKYATFLPEYGPQQRGGKAKCTVVIDDCEITSPLVQNCDILVTMNELSFKAFSDRVKPGGLLLLDANRVQSRPERDDITVIAIPVDDIADEIGNPKAGNIVIIGALIGKTGLITEDEFLDSLKKKFAAKAPEVMQMNTAALKRGIEIGKNA